MNLCYFYSHEQDEYNVNFDNSLEYISTSTPSSSDSLYNTNINNQKTDKIDDKKLDSPTTTLNKTINLLGNIAGNVADKGLNKVGDYIDKKINQYYDGKSQSVKPLEHVTSDTLKSSEQGQSNVGYAKPDTLKSSGQGQSNRERVVFNSPKSPGRFVYSKNQKTRYIYNQNQNSNSIEHKEKTEKKP
ncbi:hypothetical protein OC709_01480 ['Planchonia careya' phytoplasma]|nr:hypothetical protein ['Planchonia careya' phytoplasma]MDO8030184.1 hypothetical protein ['Planchonia careya' phytoplasma]